MPERLAARASSARRSGAGSARMLRACRSARRWSVRTVTGAALAGACLAAGIGVPVDVARAEGRAPATSPIHPSQVPPPGVSLPGFHVPPSESNGTVARGAVRVQPARMPFYVATKGRVTLYVLGTLHTGDPSDYPSAQPFRPRILAALAASPTLALELSPDDLLESQDDVAKYGVCRYACLPRLLPEPLWQRLAARLHGNPAALAEIRKMRPWLASLVVETYDSLSAGLQTEYGTEAQLQNVFLKKKGGRVIGLETLAEQMRAFTGLTLAEQREMLAQDMVQTPAQNADDVKTLHRLWRIGDADAIAAWAVAKSERLARSKALSASIDNKILYERNRRFVARMTAIAAPNRPLFVAIGALHLGGPRGVLELLRRQGYSVDAN
ncbi:TraB/GumN family protein [Burkholderia multivorans]|uniref:TraB/GumN family protein n=3 Tax=Burkholderia multivorans TaxID=87883 RepID=A0A8E2RZL9_9BURK|nr:MULTISPECIES: TraB/GumN family protein [Burkholderia]AOJ94214.1 polysaccharide biosynthesis protein GumN [Burkholderia multivorans]AVR23435.1 TraB/GumN family protein [Burkholderia multivorans]EKS9911641.1 TraB/GumN family protein [Burkholderia multivorans]KOE25127.1 polysaccharide biosynthesis protein GumN [Burkholderia multivorans R-20526]KVS13076.1 polysaccharide biosynthesis protein GumN [Burkholderia multivorans]